MSGDATGGGGACDGCDSAEGVKFCRRRCLSLKKDELQRRQSDRGGIGESASLQGGPKKDVWGKGHREDREVSGLRHRLPIRRNTSQNTCAKRIIFGGRFSHTKQTRSHVATKRGRHRRYAPVSQSRGERVFLAGLLEHLWHCIAASASQSIVCIGAKASHTRACHQHEIVCAQQCKQACRRREPLNMSRRMSPSKSRQRRLVQPGKTHPRRALMPWTPSMP